MYGCGQLEHWRRFHKQPEVAQAKKTNNKYMCCFEYIENFKEYLNNYGDQMQSRYFEYMEEETFNSNVDNTSIKSSLRKIPEFLYFFSLEGNRSPPICARYNQE